VPRRAPSVPALDPQTRRSLAALACATLAWLLAAGPPPIAAALAGVAVALGASGRLGLLWPLAAALAPGLPASLHGALAAVGGWVWLAERGRARRTRRLERRAFVDELTGLYRYAFFHEALEREIRRVERYGGELCLCLLDLDGFKRFNDAYGHAAGNDLLAAVGRAMRVQARESDLVARFGGEELAVLVQGGLDDGAALAERLRRAVAALRVETAAGEVGTTISAGVAELSVDSGADDLIEAADAALYEAKRRGRDRVVLQRAEARAA